MTKLPRTLRLDPSDSLIFPSAASPGEWALPGGFAFWDETPEAMVGKRRQAFRAGWLGLASYGWSTLVEVAEISPADCAALQVSLAGHILQQYGAPDRATAEATAQAELGFAQELCADHPPGTVLALNRRLQGGDLTEEFRTLHRRETAPVFALVAAEDEPAEAMDLTRL